MKYKMLSGAGLLLAAAAFSSFAIGNLPQWHPAGEVTGLVVPSTVGDKEPFTFAATGIVEGEVIAIKTVEGDVVETKRADKWGRVFLPAGLAAGSYLLSSKDGKSTSKLDVQPLRELPIADRLTIPELPNSFNAAQGLNLVGEGMSPNAADMSATIGGRQYPALAGTATEMKTGPLPPEACGIGPVEIKNARTGDTLMLDNILAYDLSAKLARKTLLNGEQTVLEFSLKPSTINVVVDARILGGPVSFEGGAQESLVTVIGGSGKLPMVANPGGKGPFRVGYDIHEILGAGKLAGQGVQAAQPGTTASGSGSPGRAGAIGKPDSPVGGQVGQPGEKADNKKEGCPKTRHIRDEATGWTTSEKEIPDDANPGKTKSIYIATRTVRCNIHKSCLKEKGHGGDCVFSGKGRCKEHDKTETREYDSERARKDGVKDTKIPEGIKYP
jgi:hypothetical protein